MADTRTDATSGAMPDAKTDSQKTDPGMNPRTHARPEARTKPEDASAARTRQERSAGVILFRDTPEGRLFLLLDYGRYWDYPKGHVEKGEDDQTAALRELAEETGITQADLLPGFFEEIVYFFRHPRRGLVRKTVVFFLAKTDTEAVELSHEHVGYDWVAEDEALRRVKYPTAKQVFRAASAFLSRAK